MTGLLDFIVTDTAMQIVFTVLFVGFAYAVKRTIDRWQHGYFAQRRRDLNARAISSVGMMYDHVQRYRGGQLSLRTLAQNQERGEAMHKGMLEYFERMNAIERLDPEMGADFFRSSPTYVRFGCGKEMYVTETEIQRGVLYKGTPITHICTNAFSAEELWEPASDYLFRLAEIQKKAKDPEPEKSRGPQPRLSVTRKLEL